MRKLKGVIQSTTLAILAAYGQYGEAAVINDLIVANGQTVTVNSTETVLNNFTIDTTGTLINTGLINLDLSFDQIYGTLINHGNIYSASDLYVYGLGKIFNHQDGTIVLSGYSHHFYGNEIIENKGKFMLTNPVGDNVNTGNFAYIFRGTIKNSGTLSFSITSSTNVAKLFFRWPVWVPVFYLLPRPARKKC